MPMMIGKEEEQPFDFDVMGIDEQSLDGFGLRLPMPSISMSTDESFRGLAIRSTL